MHRETAFIIDDDAFICEALMLLCSLRAMACAALASGEDFLSALQTGWRGFVVVLGPLQERRLCRGLRHQLRQGDRP